MINGFSAQESREQVECDAYNAAFYELGFRWYWDLDTYSELLRHSDSPDERIHHYLSTRQPHLLRAYDSWFLVEAIQQKQTSYLSQMEGRSLGEFNWAQALDRELGA